MSLTWRKELQTHLKSDLPRLSFYRMVKSKEFDELCRFYNSLATLGNWNGYFNFESIKMQRVPPLHFVPFARQFLKPLLIFTIQRHIKQHIVILTL
jgi:hypothetical protein